jgi:tape measure domain-containing protein
MATVQPLHYVISANDKAFLNALIRDGRALNTLTLEAGRAGSNIDSMFKKIGAAAGVTFGLSQLKGFVGEIINVRSQMQMLDSSFTVLLGSKAKADAMLADIREVVAKSPYSLPDMTSAAQMMLSFNISAEKIIPTLKQLGDISMGNSDRFRALTLAFSQMSAAGKLMGQDLLQMINAGFNPLQIMAAKTGKSMSALRDEMAKGDISSEMVAEAFREATAEGSKFHNMMEKQASGIAGLQGSLSTAWTDMLNELGEKSQGAIESGYKMTAALVENYEKVGEAIAALITMYGLYKAAVITDTVVKKTATATMYEAELAAYRKLLPAKAAAANSDIQEAVASGRLTESKAAAIIAIRQEIAARLQSLQIAAAEAKAEAARAAAAHKAALQRSLAAKNLVRQRTAELAQTNAIVNRQAYEAAQKNLLAAQEERHAASIAKKNTAQVLSAANSKKAAAATALDTFTTNLDAASKERDVLATNRLTAAKLRLSKAMKALTGSMLTNPYVLAAAAVAALGYGIYKLVTYQTAAEKAQKRLNDSLEEAQVKFGVEKRAIDYLFDGLKKVKKGSDDYRDALKRINELYGQYLPNQLTEKSNLDELTLAYNRVTEAISGKIFMEMKDATLNDLATEQLKKQVKASENLRGVLEKNYKFSSAQTEDVVKNAIETAKRLYENGASEYDAVMAVYNSLKDKKGNSYAIDSKVASGMNEIVTSIYNIGRASDEADKKFGPFIKKVSDLGKSNEGVQDAIKNKAYWEKIKKEAEEERNKLAPGTGDWDALTKKIAEADAQLKAYNTTQGSGKGAGKALESERKLENELIDLRLKTEKQLADMREDSFAKRRLQIESEYGRERQEVKEEEEKLLKLLQERETSNWIAGGKKGAAPVISSLPAEMKAEVDAAYKAVEEVRRKREEVLQRDIAEMAKEENLRFADGLMKRMADIEDYYRERISQAEGDEELIAKLMRSKEREIKAAYSEYSQEMLAYDLEVTKARIAGSKKAFKYEADRRKAELKKEKAAAEERIRLMEEQYQATPTEELAKNIALAKIELEGLNRELAEMPVRKLEETADHFSKITDALGDLDGEFGEVFSALSDSFDSISGSLKNAADMESRKISEAAGEMNAYAAAIKGAVSLINLAVSAAKERDRVEKEFYKNQIALAHEYALAVNEQIRTQSEIIGSGFLKDYAGEIKDGFEALTDATGKYREAMAKLSDGKARVDLRNAIDWGQVGKGAATGAAAGLAIGTVVPVIGQAIGLVVGTIVGGVVGLFAGKKKEIVDDSLLAVFPELVDAAGNLNRELAEVLINTDQVDESTKQLLQNALDWADAVEAANEQIKELTTEMAGDLGGSIKSALMEAFKAGEDASKRMFKAASDSLGDFVENMLYSAIFSDVFKTFGEELAASLDPVKGDQDVVDDYERLMDNLEGLDDYYLSLLDAIDKRAKERGFNLWENEEEERQGSKGLAASMTQDQATEMNGFLNNGLIFWRDIANHTGLIYAHLTSGGTNSWELLSNHAQNMMRHLANIESNTEYCRRLEGVETGIRAVKTVMEDIRDRGIKLKATA